MAKSMQLRFYVAFADRVVETDDIRQIPDVKLVTAFDVLTQRSFISFVSIVENGVDPLLAARRWVGTHAPSGVIGVKVWKDDQDREQSDAGDIISFAPGVWRTVQTPVTLILKDDANDEPEALAAHAGLVPEPV